MNLSARPTTLDEIQNLRDIYRLEMNCQIIHDSIHERSGWTREYLILSGSDPVGYGSMAVKGPWTEAPSIYEFYVVPPYRTRLFECFRVLLDQCGAKRIETQSNDLLLTNMLFTYCNAVQSEAILFHDKFTTCLSLSRVLVQELKRMCYAQGSVPGARCNVNNQASQATLQKAGFVPCGHIVFGNLS
jgi:hypothetical protein